MALTAAQKRTIQEEARKAAIKRAQIQSKKISDKEARVASSTMKKGSSNTYRGTPRDKPLLSKSETAALGRQSKINADIERQRKLAKAGKAPSKATRVGTLKEYKALGREIELKAKLRLAAQQAAKNQAERAKKRKPVETPKFQSVEEAKKSAPTPKTQAAGTSTKAQTLAEAKSKAPTPKSQGAASTSRLQTLEEAKARAPKPGVRIASAPEAAKTKTKVTSAVKTAASKTKAGKTVTAANKAFGPKSEIGQKVTGSKAGKIVKGAGKVGGKLFKLGAIVAAGKEVGQIVSGQAEKDFRRIQALENKIAIAKGQKPKYTTTGTNKNLLSSVKTDLGVAANIATGGMSGKTRKERLAELQKMLKTAQSNKKPDSKPTSMKVTDKPATSTNKLTGGSKYRVSSGDTLSGIASRAGVTLAELRAANPQLKDKGIFRNTGVVIPKKGKMPTGGYTGPVPYKPGKKK